MIYELYLYLTSKVIPEAKKFGHLYEAISIGAREKRCQFFWKNHREESKKLILNVIEKLEVKNNLLILGSGPLHEIPIEELSKQFKLITLVDIVHLKSTKKKYKYLNNINYIEHDITEVESIIFKKKEIYNITPSSFLENSYDCVISANILSQLAYHPRKFLESKSLNLISLKNLDKFSHQISKDHLQYLQKFQCTVLLITDIETYLINRKGETTEVQTPYIDFNLPPPVKTWLWDLAPIPEYSSEISLQMKVAGFILHK